MNPPITSEGSNRSFEPRQVPQPHLENGTAYRQLRPTFLDRMAPTKVNVHDVSMMVNPAASEGPEQDIPIRSSWHQVYSEKDSTPVLLAEGALSS